MNRDIKKEKAIYDGLSRVLREDGYSTIVFNKIAQDFAVEEDRAYMAKLFYGVLEKSVQFDYIIAKVAEKRPKPAVVILLKMGLYLQRHMCVPDYAVTNIIISLSRALGKGVDGFLNAFFRAAQKVTMPNRGELPRGEYISIVSSCPIFIVNKLMAQYGEDKTEAFLKAGSFALTHIRHNPAKIEKSDFEKLLKLSIPAGEELKTSEFGYYVTHNMLKNLPRSLYTAQSYSSMLAVKCYAENLSSASRVLDLCAAPGGKAVYLRQITGADIFACDLYPHRVKLIEAYAERMGVRLKTAVGDASEIKPEYKGRFDCVICDVPCSGLGELASKPDIMLRRDAEALERLCDLQKRILLCAREYVRPGGVLYYSTCTVLKEENEDNAGYLLSLGGFEKIYPVGADADGFVRVYPEEGKDGFFVSAFRRIV